MRTQKKNGLEYTLREVKTLIGRGIQNTLFFMAIVASIVALGTFAGTTAEAQMKVDSVNGDIFAAGGIVLDTAQAPAPTPLIRTANAKLEGVGTVTIGPETGYPRIGLQAGTTIEVSYYFQNEKDAEYWDGVLTAPSLTQNPDGANIQWLNPEEHEGSTLTIVETYAFTPPHGVVGFSNRATVAFRPENVTDGTILYFAFHQGAGYWTIRDDAKCVVKEGLCTGTVGRVEQMALIIENRAKCPSIPVPNGTYGIPPQCRIVCNAGYEYNEESESCVANVQREVTEADLMEELYAELTTDIEEEAAPEVTEESRLAATAATEPETTEEQPAEEPAPAEETPSVNPASIIKPAAEEAPKLEIKERGSTLLDRIAAATSTNKTEAKPVTYTAEQTGFIIDKNGKKRYVGKKKTLADVLDTEQTKPQLAVRTNTLSRKTATKTETTGDVSMDTESEKVSMMAYIRAAANAIAGNSTNDPQQMNDLSAFTNDSENANANALPHAGALPLAGIVIIGLMMLVIGSRRRRKS